MIGLNLYLKQKARMKIILAFCLELYVPYILMQGSYRFYAVNMPRKAVAISMTKNVIARLILLSPKIKWYL